MITEQLNHLDYSPTEWQQQLAQGFTNINELCHFLQLSIADLPVSNIAAKSFPLRVPLSFASCMEKGNPNDPLLRQVIPVQDELNSFPGFSDDPVGDLDAALEHGVLKKYHGRALFITTGSCAINCRYCFRRNFPYSENQLTKQKLDIAILYIRNHREIIEVILSGGDPLLLSDQRLGDLFNKLAEIKHLQRIRIHSRIPVVLPGRITPGLLKVLTASNKQLVMVIHSNHVKELSTAVADACAAMQQNQITLLNQSVLLKDVNDTAEQLCKLSEKLFTFGVLPYYLHLLDKAQGTGHFEVPETTAVTIMRQLQEKLPGYLVPKLVRETAGALSKSTVAI